MSFLKHILKKVINKLLKILNLKLTRYSDALPKDFSGVEIHPIALSNICEIKNSLLNLRLENGRTNRFYSLAPDSFDPYLFSLNQSLKKNLVKKKDLFDSIFNIIKFYKENISVTEINDFYGIQKSNHCKLSSYPVWAAIWPWDVENIETRMKNFPASVKADRKRNGFTIQSNNPDEIMNQDRKYSLPSHINQYVNLISKLQHEGYRPEINENYIEAEILIKEKNFCWKPGGEGNHRVTVLASLGVKKFKCLVTKIIRYEDAEYWPNVLNNTFTKEDAENIFNRFFHAEPPEYNKMWNLYCKKLIENEN